ncbi:MAG: hypothetical protein A3J57_01810 [Candidatus Wildermuthbacteria bacterium RIFCSPHIGHO2_02_FULL_49_12b]|nr:MAG: hypothetical protein A3J57_01810 [Candidatus Wildermuthbacteria bacterium RIFCSPHIGHO2_02_FULL_49_12b]
MSQDMLGTSALAEVAGPLKDFAERLGGSRGTQWLGAFKRFLRKEEPWPKFTVWKTIKLGMEHRALDFDARRIRILQDVLVSFNTVSFAVTVVEVELVVLTTTERGFKVVPRYEDIWRRALEWGLELCPAEVGPQLRLQYLDQPRDDRLRIAMNPVVVAGSRRDEEWVYEMGCDKDSILWLDGIHPDARSYDALSRRWVFVQPR